MPSALVGAPAAMSRSTCSAVAGWPAAVSARATSAGVRPGRSEGAGGAEVADGALPLGGVGVRARATWVLVLPRLGSVGPRRRPWVASLTVRKGERASAAASRGRARTASSSRGPCGCVCGRWRRHRAEGGKGCPNARQPLGGSYSVVPADGRDQWKRGGRGRPIGEFMGIPGVGPVNGRTAPGSAGRRIGRTPGTGPRPHHPRPVQAERSGRSRTRSH